MVMEVRKHNQETSFSVLNTGSLLDLRKPKLKGAIDDILNINKAANNYWLCRER